MQSNDFRFSELLIIDEADRLNTSGLKQPQDFLDRSDLGMILIGMPGFDRQHHRYPQLDSRVAFRSPIPLFPTVHKTGAIGARAMSGDAVNVMIRRRADRAGFPPRKYSFGGTLTAVGLSPNPPTGL